MPASFTRRAALAILLAATPALAWAFPEKPVTLVIPFAAGGSTDVVGRIVAERMSQDLGQQVVVENVGGAGGSLGAVSYTHLDVYKRQVVPVIPVAPDSPPAEPKPLVSSPPTNGDPVTLGLPEEEELRDLLIIAVTPEDRRQAARELVSKAITRLSRTRGETWIQKARLRPFIQRMDPTFNESNFGFRSFSEMLASMADLVETRKAESDHELRLRKTKATGQ